MGMLDHLRDKIRDGTRVLHRSDTPPAPLSTEEQPEAADPHRHHGTAKFNPPSTGRLKPVEAWWRSKPEISNRTYHLAPSEAELARQVTMQIQTGRVCCIRPPEWARVLLLLLGRDELQPARLAEVFHRAPDLPREVIDYVLLQAGAAGRQPTSAEDWQQILNAVDLNLTLHEILTNCAKQFHNSGSTTDTPFATALWDHVLATAMVIEHLAQLFRFRRPLLAYATALFHDMGHMVVAWTLHHAAQGQETDPRLRDELARNLHEEAGGLAAKLWLLPEPCRHVIAHHHQAVEADDHAAALRALLQLADESVLRCGHGELETPQRAPLLELGCAKILKLTEQCAPTVLDPIPSIAIQATL